MKRLMAAAATMALLSLAAPRAYALDVGSDGLSGNFNPASSVQVDLSLATTGDLSTPGTVNGVYDPVRWAVIFKYASVNIPAGVTVTFESLPSRAPVVWLVQENATVNGSVNLDSSPGNATAQRSPRGPGGFAGREGPYATPATIAPAASPPSRRMGSTPGARSS